MLTELRIKNFAIIEALALPLAPGFNVLSGETGAGKSIIVGALGMLLGERANADMIRTGTDRATVEGTFNVAADSELAKILDARGREVGTGASVDQRHLGHRGGPRRCRPASRQPAWPARGSDSSRSRLAAPDP